MAKKHKRTAAGWTKEKERLRIKTAKQRVIRKIWYNELKSGLACVRCKENAPCCLVFHHIDPDKKNFNIAGAACMGISKPRILAEIDKCLVLCANCHRKLHAGLRLREIEQNE